MGATIGGGDVPGEVVHRPRQRIEIVGKRGGEKRDLQADAGSLEGVDRVQWSHLQRNLLHGRNLARIQAHVAVGQVIDPDEAGERLICAGPMARVDVGQPVRHGPNAEIWVVGHQRDDRWSLLRSCRQRGRATCDGHA